jgi:hypothetical protein
MMSKLQGRGCLHYFFQVCIVFTLLAVGANVYAQCPASCTSANSCNNVSSKTILPPDLGVGATVYETVRTSCACSAVKSCTSSFVVTSGMTTTTKCTALVNAINNNPACTGIGYSVAPADNNCATTQTFVVRDTCAGGVLSLGISNNPNVFTQESTSAPGILVNQHPLPDYEEEIITPGCRDEDNTAGNCNDNASQVTLGGVATGTSIVTAEAAHVEADFKDSAGVIHHAEIATSQGMTASQIAENLATQLIGQGVPVRVFNGRAIRVTEPTSGNPTALAIATGDSGINTDARVQTVSLLPIPTSTPVPTISTWSVLTLTVAILISSIFLLRRRRRESSI